VLGAGLDMFFVQLANDVSVPCLGLQNLSWSVDGAGGLQSVMEKEGSEGRVVTP